MKIVFLCFASISCGDEGSSRNQVTALVGDPVSLSEWAQSIDEMTTGSVVVASIEGGLADGFAITANHEANVRTMLAFLDSLPRSADLVRGARVDHSPWHALLMDSIGTIVVATSVESAEAAWLDEEWPWEPDTPVGVTDLPTDLMVTPYGALPDVTGLFGLALTTSDGTPVFEYINSVGDIGSAVAGCSATGERVIHYSPELRRRRNPYILAFFREHELGHHERHIVCEPYPVYTDRAPEVENAADSSAVSLLRTKIDRALVLTCMVAMRFQKMDPDPSDPTLQDPNRVNPSQRAKMLFDLCS